MDIAGFFQTLATKHASGDATEHSYRPALELLFASIDPGLSVMNEPQRLRDVGAPDFSFRTGDVIIGHAEAKDLGADLKHLKGREKDQRDRYLKALPNLIYTDGLLFLFYRDGKLVHEVRIGEFMMGLTPDPSQFEALEIALKDFAAQTPITIKRPEVLAKLMAGKAALIKDILGRSLLADRDANTELAGQYQAFRQHMIHDISIDDFAGMYAETIAYGMFAARLHDDTLETFSRQEALELLPKSNPFLRSLFGYIAGPDLDERLTWIIDDLSKVFQACDVASLMDGFGKLTGRADPFLHFYETFLGEYDPAKRKARGVWYTPEPVVNFIVRAVDEVLQTEFGLPMGLADTSKVTLDWDTGQTDKKGKPVTIKKDVHRVQILDPATGTGTFLAEVIKQIAPKVQGVAPGMWSQYIEADLIPRLHGFELLMASYAMCHMKLDMMLAELGYAPTSTPPRLSVYLTNSLEEGEAANQSLPFAQWLSNEVREANTIKRDMPIMCVIGNPPYSGHSSNKGAWIESLMEAYKQSAELKRPAQAKWLSDDYVKFIRMSEHLIEKNGEGILGFITNHSYLDNPTFLDMRQHLMKTFDKIFVLDLHGNTKKKEVAPDGRPDRNVFDIQQGVAIIIAIKKTVAGKSNKFATVHHADLWGSRTAKYAALEIATTDTDSFVDVTPKQAPWPFEPSDWEIRENYYSFPGVPDWFAPNGRPAPGIVTTHDQFAISWSADEAGAKVERFLQTETEAEARSFWRLCSQNQWNYDRAKIGLANGAWRDMVTPVTYRPFDSRYTIYDRNIAVHRRERGSGHMIAGANLGLTIGRQGQVVGSMPWNLVSATEAPIDFNVFYRGGGALFPLYLYPDEQDLDQTRRVNFDTKLYARLQDLADHPDHGRPDEVATFDYIYGVLHCPAYRQTYAEFLKIDFPRIPWPTDPDAFWDIAAKGGQLRRLHLMEPAAIGPTPYPFEGEGDGVVEKPRFEDGRVWINRTQSFGNAPEVSWGFYIGGYQPAQKWLKDRKGRQLSFDDIQHYQSILKILSETDRIMQTIEMDLT